MADEMFDADLISVLGDRYHDTATELTEKSKQKKIVFSEKNTDKKEIAVDASWEPVAERSFIQKLESAVKGMIVPIIAYLIFWAWLQSGMMETVPAVICMSVSMLVLGYNVRRATK